MIHWPSSWGILKKERGETLFLRVLPAKPYSQTMVVSQIHCYCSKKGKSSSSCAAVKVHLGLIFCCVTGDNDCRGAHTWHIT